MGAGAPVILEGLAHDLMLDSGWEAAAGVVEGWLEKEWGGGGGGRGVSTERE